MLKGMSSRLDVRSIDLKEAIIPITKLDGVLEIYLFGSRVYKTGSLRSDIDILIYAPNGIRADSILNVMNREDALDVFETVDKKNARSFANDSRLNRNDIVHTLDAVLLWSKDKGFNEDALELHRKQEVLVGHHFEKSCFSTYTPAQERFYKKYGRYCAFIIMPFDKDLETLYDIIKKVLNKKGITALRADEFEFEEEIWSNIRVYLDCCQFGIAVFDKSIRQKYNPNVALEVGYLMASDKKICLLKDKDLEKLPSDLLAKLYKEYDLSDLESSISAALNKWLSEYLLIK